MYKAKITNIEKERHQATNTDFLKVQFDIVDAEGEVLQSKNIGMSVDADKKAVIAEVNKHIAEYGREVENVELNKEKEKANANLKDMKDTLVGETIGVEVDEAEEQEDIKK